MEPLLPVLGIHTCPIIVGGRVRKASAHMAVRGAFSLPPIGSTAAQLVVMQPTKLLSFIFASLVLKILTSSATAERICSMEGSTLASTVLEWWSAEDSNDQLVLLPSDRSGGEV